MNIVINLKQPFWSAYGMYGWEDGVEGFGINSRLVEKALYENKKLEVRYKTARYVISPKNALKQSNLYHSTYIARDGTKLLVIPRNKFKRLPNLEESIEIPIDYKLKLKEVFNSKLRRGVKNG